MLRSHHTMVSTKSKNDLKLPRNGYRIITYKHYVFGGLIQEADGRLTTSNDLIEIQTKYAVQDGSLFEEEGQAFHKPLPSVSGEGEASLTLMSEHSGIKPMPRREHSAQIINKGTQMLIYGGKNDGAFQLKN